MDRIDEIKELIEKNINERKEHQKNIAAIKIKINSINLEFETLNGNLYEESCRVKDHEVLIDNLYRLLVEEFVKTEA